MSNVTDIHAKSPTAEEVGIDIPTTLNKELFDEGFNWGMRSNTLTNFKRSYMEGFRAAKLYLKEVRRQRGILQMPMKAQMKIGPLSG